MVDPIGDLLKISPKPPVGGDSKPSTFSVADLTKSLKGDEVSLNSDSLLEAIRSETSGLANDLPSLVQQALIAPQADAAVQQEPLNSLLFRLQNPLESILGSVDDVPEDLIVNIEKELENFKLVFPKIQNSDLLLPLLSKDGASDRLQSLIGGLTNQVDSLIGNLRNI